MRHPVVGGPAAIISAMKPIGFVGAVLLVAGWACAPPADDTGPAGGAEPPVAAAARAGLIVDPGDGAPLTRCVELEAVPSSGIELLERSGLAVAYQAGARGTMVCALAGTGCDFPAEPCLCACSGGEECRYWSLWQLDAGGSWQRAEAGADRRTVAAGSVQGWRWGDGSPPPAAAGVAAICG